MNWRVKAMVDYKALGGRMKMRRRMRHISQGKLASAVNVSASFYGNIERGTRIPSVDTLVSIANELQVGTDYLLADSLKCVSQQHTPEEMRVLTRYLQEQIAELQFLEARDEEK